jgi:hypothetical protein
MLYEMLVGEVPIRAENYNQLMYRVTMSDFRPPRQRRALIPAGLEQIILHAMAQRPADRPGDAFTLEQALLPFCRPMFREHATGRITSPALSLRSSEISVRPSNGAKFGDSINYAMFEGSTIPDAARDIHPPDEPARRRGSASGAGVDPGDVSAIDADPSSIRALPAAAVDDDPVSTTMAKARRRNRRRVVAGLALAGGAAAAIALVLARGDGPLDAPPPAAARQAPIAAAAPRAPVEHVVDLVMSEGSPPTGSPPTGSPPTGSPPTGEPAATITLRLAIDPIGAAITVDGERVTGTEIVVRKDGAPHRLRIAALGYLEYDETIRFDESQRLVVQLKRAVGVVRGKDRQKDRKPERTGSDRPERIESRSPYE